MAVSTKFCRECGAEIPTNSKFCEKCGTRLTEAETREAHLAPTALREDRAVHVSPTYNVEQIRRQHPKAYAKWARDEDERLARLCRDGKTVGEMADILQRQPGAIQSRLRYLRMIPRSRDTGTDEGDDERDKGDFQPSDEA